MAGRSSFETMSQFWTYSNQFGLEEGFTLFTINIYLAFSTMQIGIF